MLGPDPNQEFTHSLINTIVSQGRLYHLFFLDEEKFRKVKKILMITEIVEF